MVLSYLRLSPYDRSLGGSSDARYVFGGVCETSRYVFKGQKPLETRMNARLGNVTPF
jgi:hypothetical protein